MRLSRIGPILLLAAALAVGGTAGAKDAVHFKDGMRTVCTGPAWEEQDQVLCEYEGGVLSYPKADVDRIIKAVPTPLPPETPSSSAADPTRGAPPNVEANSRTAPLKPS